jgi:type I restriction enzyme, S subunit
VALWARTLHYWDQIRAVSLQATIENVSAERYKDLLIPVPQRGLQDHVLNRLERARRDGELLRTKLDDQIRLLAEHRQALITAGVTGELDVARAA